MLKMYNNFLVADEQYLRGKLQKTVALLGTPFVPNYKSFQESWRVKPSQSLTKIIERNIKIYDIK